MKSELYIPGQPQENFEEKTEILTPETAKTDPVPDRFYVWTRNYGETVSTLKPGFEKEVPNIVEKEYKLDVPESVLDLCMEVRRLGGRALLVGGAVRDAVISAEHPEFNLNPKDFDVEIFGLDQETVRLLLETKYGKTKLEGESFKVFKVDMEGVEEAVDTSIPREETSTGAGHTDYKINGDPSLGFVRAAIRRDLTINTLGYDPLEEKVYDAFGGIEAIKNRVIEVTDNEKFQEDPLRVLRIMQFASRFGFDISQNAKDLCKEMVENGAVDKEPSERFTEEFKKLLIKGIKPSIGLEFAREVGLLNRYWPELNALVDFKLKGDALERTEALVLEGAFDSVPEGEVPQEYDWHPEGDVWEHEKQVVDAAVEIANREIEKDTFLTDEQVEVVESKASGAIWRARQEQTIQKYTNFIEDNVLDGIGKLLEIDRRVEAIGHAVYDSTLKTQMEGVHSGKRSLEDMQGIARSRAQLLQQSERIGFLRRTAQKAVEENPNLATLVMEVDLEIERLAEKAGLEETAKAKKELNEENKLVLALAALGHDLAKATTTEFYYDPETNEGRWRALGHEAESVVPTEAFLDRFDFSKKIKQRVLGLVPGHMSPVALWKTEVEQKQDVSKGMRRLAVRLSESGNSIRILSLLAEADHRGRNPEKGYPLPREEVKNLQEWQSWFEQKAEELNVTDKPPVELLRGQDLLDAIEGARGGIWMGVVLNAVRQDELDGVVTTSDAALQRGMNYFNEFGAVVENVIRTEGISEREAWTRLKDIEDPRTVIVG